MNLLSKEMEKELVEGLLDICEEKISQALEVRTTQAPYIQQKNILKELDVGYDYFKKFEALGLKRVKIDPNDRIIFFKRSDLYELMDGLAR